MQKKCPLYRDVRFIEIFSKIVWPQSKAICSSSHCPPYGSVRFIVRPFIEISLYFSKDSLCFVYFDVIICQQLKKSLS